MYQLVPAFLARFGPWFGRMVAASPSLLAKVVAKLRLSDPKSMIGDSVKDVVAYAKQNPASAVLVMTTLTSLGMSIVDLFGGDDEVTKLTGKLDPESASFLTSLASRDRAMALSPQSFAATVAAADLSATLNTGLAANAAQNEVAIEVLSFAKRFFGTPAGAIEGHRLLQSFMEMSHADVTVGFTTLKLR